MKSFYLHYIKVMNNIAFLLILLNLWSCAKEVQSSPVVKHNQDPEQYGIPYTGVPDSRDVSIYQINMRCFSATHNFQGVTNRLDNIKALGVNVIYLMPIYPVGILKSVNSPYCVKDYKSVN